MQLIKEINLNILQLKRHKITSTFLCGENKIILNRVIARERETQIGRREKKKKRKGRERVR